MHLWDHRTGYKYFVEEYARDVAEPGHNVVATVYVECHSMYPTTRPKHLRSVGETEFAVGMVATWASGKYTSTRAAVAIVAHIDLTPGDRTREALEAHVEAANGGLRDILQRRKWDADPEMPGRVVADRPSPGLEPESGRGLDLLASRGFAFDASVDHPQIRDVTALARAHPDAGIRLIHSGSSVRHASYAGGEAEVYAR